MHQGVELDRYGFGRKVKAAQCSTEGLDVGSGAVLRYLGTVRIRR